jgi:hypothetical protein
VFQLTALALVVISALAGTGLARWLSDPGQPQPRAKLQFPTWAKPDLTLFLTAQMHGYLLPCGCSRPQIGGLERRYNLLQMIKEKGWSVMPLDLGDIAQKEGPARLPNIQGKIKYRYAMRALNLMGYPVVGSGEYEAALPTIEAITEILSNPNESVPLVLSGNLDPKCDLKVAMQSQNQLDSWKVLEDPASKLKVGITSVIGSDTASRIKDVELKLTPSAPALTGILKELDAQKPDYRVLLYHGSLTRGQFMKGFQAEAVEVAKAFPQFDIVLCLTEEEEPPANPTVVKHKNGRETLVLGVGHKGKYIGVLGLYKKATGFESKWELVQLSEDFLTPEAKEAEHPVVKLMEAYTKDLKNGNYLGKAPAIPHASQVSIQGKTPVYVGSQECARCHEAAYAVWKETPHSHAYKTLEDAKRPSNRQYDPECIVCHTVGYGYKSGFRDATQTPLLKNVGCESCHGPCSEHVKAQDDMEKDRKQWYPVINPYRAPLNETPADKTKRMGRIDQFCQKCHDIDNDVTWGHIGFAAKWKKVEHYTPGK